jgi:pimeloyl-ACP methyl ester carboxylesterase
MNAKSRIGVMVVAFLVAATTAQAQVLTSMPVEGAPLAHPGPYKVVQETAFGSPGYIVFRPANLNKFPREDTLPVMVWANGGCDADSSPYFAFLSTIASHGFLVLATSPINGVNDPYLKGGPGYEGMTSPLRTALDWAESETLRGGSLLKGKVATDRMAAMGVSCGGGITVMFGSEPRIDTVGVISDPSWGAAHFKGDPKDFHLKRLHGPVMILNGGESDIAMAGSAGSFEAIDHVPVFYGSRRNAGHMSTFAHPGGGEFANVASSWLRWTLKGDRKSGAMFMGAQCELCADPNWETRSKALTDVQTK